MFIKLNLATDYFIYVNKKYIVSIIPIDDHSCNVIVTDGGTSTKYYCIESSERILNLLEN